MTPNFERPPSSSGTEHVKVQFDVVRDDAGYPPATSEMLWAVPLGPTHFRLDNIPFFVCGVSCFDVVEVVEEVAGHFKFRRLLEPSGHSTLRVIFYNQESDPRFLGERVQELSNKFRTLGCSSEISHIPGLISVDVPPGLAVANVRVILDAGVARGVWDYEEATLADSVH
jgi:hypothetical protein